MTAIYISEKEGELCSACLVLCSWMQDWKRLWQHKRDTTANMYMLCWVLHRIGKHKVNIWNYGSTFYPGKVPRACVAVVDIHGYAMHWGSFTSSSRGTISGPKIHQVFFHTEQHVAQEVRNILPLTLKKASRWVAWKGSCRNTSQIPGEALLPSIRAGASRSVWEFIYWQPQKGGTCHKLCQNTAGLIPAVSWSPDSSPRHDLLQHCLCFPAQLRA